MHLNIRTICAYIAAAVASTCAWIIIPYIAWLLAILVMLCFTAGAGFAAYHAVQNYDRIGSWITTLREQRAAAKANA